MKKGQLISLDFLISIILVVLSIGLIMQLSEVENYNFKDKTLRDETYIRGKTAASLLVNSPETTCELVDIRDKNKIISPISNCLTEFVLPYPDCGGAALNKAPCLTWDEFGTNHRTFKPIRKKFLGLTDDYSCYLKVVGGKANSDLNAVLLTECESSPPALAKNVYAIKLNVMINNGNFDAPVKTITIDKNEFEHCISGEGLCTMYPATITFMVWKNE